MKQIRIQFRVTYDNRYKRSLKARGFMYQKLKEMRKKKMYDHPVTDYSEAETEGYL